MQELAPLPPQKKSSNKGLIIVISLVAVVFLAVPCIGVLAAIAIPAFVGYLSRAKTAEAESNLSALFQGAASYYDEEHYEPGGAMLTACAVGSATTPNIPSSGKSVLSPPLGEPFDALGFAPADPVYYRYEIVGVGGCGHTAGESLYSFRASGDLDGDGATSLFEISAGASSDNVLMRAPGIYRQDELE